MSKRLSAGIMALALGVAGCVSTDPEKVAKTPEITPAPAKTAFDFDTALAAARTDSGAKPLKASAALTKSAQDHAADMVKRDFYDHKTPDGVNFDTRNHRAGYCVAAMAENIAEGYKTEAAAFKGWMDSESHRKNILNRKYTRYGFGKSGGYWVMELAGPCVKT
ncbi:CAP domain-containing protein [Thalassovita sp.]|uniref:CAP domain-containing protein n=1 Tax=Thalassovita sp. TaxID=1979401 RepID=UPI002880EFC7|nr:CAP domain-containing protein [Thalassovita sp.]MDF1801779.1 CAP domain-containing protein [Thalassovita sp.]